MNFATRKFFADELISIVREHVDRELRKHVEETERRSAQRIEMLEKRITELEAARSPQKSSRVVRLA